MGPIPFHRHSTSILAATARREDALRALASDVDGKLRAANQRAAFREDQQKTCLICLRRQRTHVLACLHCVACDGCGAHIVLCPVCRYPTRQAHVLRPSPAAVLFTKI